jgi:epoxyqueuosine reductase QueG
MALEYLIEEFLKERGALAVGIATTETLAGGPPSADITYRMEGARSAVSFALPLDRDRIRAFLAKQDRFGHEEDNIRTNLRSRDLSWELAEMLKKEGHRAKGTAANMKYRQDEEGWQLALHPDISHRYMAVRSGTGSFGWSGNVGIVGPGTAIILGTTVPAAALIPPAPRPCR